MTLDRRFARHYALVALSLAALYLAGRSRLTPPPLAHPSRVPAWWSGEGPVVAVFSAARVAVLIAGLYWLTLLAIVAAMGTLSPRRLARLALARSAPDRRLVGARQAVRLVLGASALGSAITGGAAPVFAASSSGPGPPIITNLAGPGPPAASLPAAQPDLPGLARPGSTTIVAPPAPGPVATAGSEPPPSGTTSADQEAHAPDLAPAPPLGKRSVSEPPAVAAPAGAGRPTAPAYGAPTRPSDVDGSTAGNRTAGGSAPTILATGAGGGRAAAPSEWIVRPGDNLWFIAEQTLAAGWDRSPSDRQVAGYWMSVIATNRSRLPDPSDPSLLFAGDIIVLPPLPDG